MMKKSRVMRMRDGQDDNDDNDDVLPTRGGQSFGYAWCFTSLQQINDDYLRLDRTSITILQMLNMRLFYSFLLWP